jgi:hypothetical protein
VEELERPLIELARSDEFTPERYLATQAEMKRKYAEIAEGFARR